ncbi:hypothetical protein LEP1GSC088_2141 [Leptospira interrogans str. L1207]|nr:hypothetical protein LEP1GSC088_2141 [Leptospira interrogans str. L1207]
MARIEHRFSQVISNFSPNNFTFFEYAYKILPGGAFGALLLDFIGNVTVTAIVIINLIQIF